MKFIMHIDMKYQIEELKEAGIHIEKAYPGKENCFEANDYIVEITSLKQAVELTKKLEQDLVIVEGGEEAFFFSGYYEG